MVVDEYAREAAPMRRAEPRPEPPAAMPIICPSCQTSYRISAEALGVGRQVRCVKCRAEWFAVTEIEAPALPATVPARASDGARTGLVVGLDDASEIDAIEAAASDEPRGRTVAAARGTAGSAGPGGFDRRQPPSAARTRRLGVTLRPSAMVAALGIAALGLLLSERVAVVELAPSLASLYRAVGLPVNVRGLAIRDLRSVEDAANGAPLLLVTGLVENVSDAELDVPRLRLAVTASGGREIYAWTTLASRPKLAPGDTAAFRARLASPPAEGQAVAVRFLARRDLTASLGR